MKQIDNDVIEKLQKHIEVPEIVQIKADKTLEEIKSYAKQEKKIVRPVFWKRKVKVASVLLAGALALGTVTVGAAAIYQWYQRAAHQMQADESQQKKLMEEGMATGVCASVEEAGVTVEAVQTIADYRYIYIWFQIKNNNQDLMLPDGVTFENMDVSTENWKGAYGINSGILEKISDDGTYELKTEIAHEMKESLNGKKIKVSFKNLVEFDENLDKHVLLEGNWNLEWTLQASDKISEIALNKEIQGYDNVVLEKINLTPISATLYFLDWKDRMEEVKVMDENGKETIRKMRQEPPALVGFLMKDGTVVTDFKGGPGMAGMDEDGDGTTYIQSDGFSRVIDVENVSSLLFLKKEALEEIKEEEKAITKEDMMEIPLK